MEANKRLILPVIRPLGQSSAPLWRYRFQDLREPPPPPHDRDVHLHHTLSAPENIILFQVQYHKSIPSTQTDLPHSHHAKVESPVFDAVSTTHAPAGTQGATDHESGLRHGQVRPKTVAREDIRVWLEPRRAEAADEPDPCVFEHEDGAWRRRSRS